MSKFTDANKKIENAVVSKYKKIEDTVVNKYKKIEDSAVSKYQKIEDKFIDTFLAEDNETTAQAKDRIKENKKKL